MNSNNISDRKTLRPKDFVLLAFAAAVAVSSYFFLHFTGRGDSCEAVISHNGIVIERIPLDKDIVFKPEGINMEFTVSEGGICVSYADCRDKVCMNTGYIYGSHETIVCLPNRISVRIENNTDSNIDAILN